MVPPKDELGTLYEEAETLVHYSCFTAEIFMLTDLELQSPAIKRFISMLEFEKMAFENFKKKQKCTVFCCLMELTDLAGSFITLLLLMHLNFVWKFWNCILLLQAIKIVISDMNVFVLAW